ncbi:MAG: hypothetical protein IKJ30_06250 [Bacilli bacterium]|nr:hypothetical protein [Bacilli bacterium]
MNLWMLSDILDETGIEGEKLCELWNSVIGIVTTVIWILVGVLAIILIVKGVTTALAVVKAADEPQVRQEKLGAFKYLAIGMGVALVIAVLAGTLLSVFGDSMVNKALGTDCSSGS